MIEVTKVKILKDGTTDIVLTDHGKPIHLDKDRRTPHPDFINALQRLDIHAAILAPRMLQREEYKRKKEKIKNEETGKDENWFRPEFELKTTADEFHCIGFTITDKGAVKINGSVTNDQGFMQFNCPQKSLIESDLFGTYEFIDDLRRCVNQVKKEAELYYKDKVHPNSKSDDMGNDDIPSIQDDTVKKIKGVGGHDEFSQPKDAFYVDPAKRLDEVEQTVKKGKGKKHTVDNPSGS